MSAYSYSVVIASKERGECAAVRGEMICQLPAGHRGVHRDGSGTFVLPKPKRQRQNWDKWHERHGEFDIQCD